MDLSEQAEQYMQASNPYKRMIWGVGSSGTHSWMQRLIEERTNIMGQFEILHRGLRYGVTTTVMPRIQNYYTKHKGEWVTQYNSCLGSNLPLLVLTGSH